MGCTNSTKNQEVETRRCKLNENGSQHLFYATTEFDISTSESEDEYGHLSLKSMNNNDNNNKLTKKLGELLDGLTTVNTNSSTTSSALLDNRLRQTRV